MKIVLTYGTFDLFHTGHYNIIKRAKERGDYLIVGVTSDNYDKQRGKLNVKQTLSERIENVRRTGLADKIIVEEYIGQKIDDIIKYHVDEFVVGSDWLGKFDYLKEYCKVTYLERTKGVSSTELRKNKFGTLKIGYIGEKIKAKGIIQESKYVSGIEFISVFDEQENKAKQIYEENMLESYTTNYENFLKNINAIFITKTNNQYEYIKVALENKKNIIFERNSELKEIQIKELYNLAKKNKVILFEAISTIYSPGFLRLINMCKSRTIGEIKSIDIIYSKKEKNIKDSLICPLMTIAKIIGTDFLNLDKFKVSENGNDIFEKINIKFDNTITSIQVSPTMNLNDEMMIIGTGGYIIVEKPWWRTEIFTIFNGEKNKKYYFDFDEDGIRYELSDFLNTILSSENYQRINLNESVFISKVMEELK